MERFHESISAISSSLSRKNTMSHSDKNSSQSAAAGSSNLSSRSTHSVNCRVVDCKYSITQLYNLVTLTNQSLFKKINVAPVFLTERTSVRTNKKRENKTFKGCVHYIFASLFFASKREHL